MAVFKINRSQLKWSEDCNIFDILSQFKHYTYSKNQLEVVIGRKFYTIKVNAYYCCIRDVLEYVGVNKLIASSKSIKWFSDWCNLFK